MKKEKIIIILLILLFISGCQYFGRSRTAETAYTRYHQGHQGLDLRFVPGMPPSIVYDQPNSFFTDRSEMTVLVEVRNKGAFDIGTTISDRPYGKGYLLLHGYDETIIRNLKPGYNLDPRLSVIDLDNLNIYGSYGIEGKSRYNVEGGFTVVEFPPRGLGYSTINLPEGADRYPLNLAVSACYEYYTEASPIICIDPDPYSERTDKACRVGGISRAIGKGAKSYVAAVEGIALGQGAPVTISNVEETAMLGRAEFKIYIQNTGGGKVLHLDTIYDYSCGFSNELTYQDFDYINYIVTMNDPNIPVITAGGFDFGIFTVPGRQLDCRPKPPIRLDSTGRTVIHCTTAGFDFYGKSAYKTPLNIRLRYGYMNSEIRPIEIRRTT